MLNDRLFVIMSSGHPTLVRIRIDVQAVDETAIRRHLAVARIGK